MNELAKRTISGVVLIAVAFVALWLGGAVFQILVALVGALILWEWRGMSLRFLPAGARVTWGAAMGVYVILAMVALIAIRHFAGFTATLTLLASVWATDIGAYAAGRTIGGPKIAPRISPSKTWAGLGGGMIAASVLIGLAGGWRYAPLGVLVAVLAQAGDFFESWLKRRAGVKDSGSLIPGHGGVFDRIDGLLPVAIVAGVFGAARGYFW